MASYGTNNNPFGSDEPDKIQEARKQVIWYINTNLEKDFNEELYLKK